MDKRSVITYKILLIITALALTVLGAIMIHKIATTPESTPDWMLSGWAVAVAVILSIAACAALFVEMLGDIKSKTHAIVFCLGSSVFSAGIILAIIADRKPIQSLTFPLLF